MMLKVVFQMLISPIFHLNCGKQNRAAKFKTKREFFWLNWSLGIPKNYPMRNKKSNLNYFLRYMTRNIAGNTSRFQPQSKTFEHTVPHLF